GGGVRAAIQRERRRRVRGVLPPPAEAERGRGPPADGEESVLTGTSLQQEEKAVVRTAERAAAGGIFRFQQRFAPFLFVSPFLILFTVFGLYPIVKSIALSLYATNGPKDHVFVGLANYRFLFTDPDFGVAVRNTAVYTFWTVFLQLPLALGLAI